MPASWFLKANATIELALAFVPVIVVLEPSTSFTILRLHVVAAVSVYSGTSGAPSIGAQRALSSQRCQV